MICPIEFVLNAIFGGSVKYIGLLIILCIFFYLIKGKEKIILQSPHLFLLFWAAYELFSVLWTSYNEWTIPYVTTYISMCLLYIGITIIRYNQQDYESMLLFALIGSMFISILMLTQQETYYQASYSMRQTVRLFGVEKDPNGIAASILIGVAVSLFYFIKSKGLIRLVSFTFLLIQLGAMSLTGSRGGFLSVCVLIVGYIVVNAKKGNSFLAITKNFIKVSSSVFAILLLVSIFIPDYFTNRFFDFEAYSTGSGRTELWQTAWEGIEDNIIFGNGVSSQAKFFLDLSGVAYGIHNTYLLVLFETGIIGLILFMFPFLKVMKMSWTKNRALEIGFLTASMASAFFLDALIARYLWNALILVTIGLTLELKPEWMGYTKLDRKDKVM